MKIFDKVNFIPEFGTRLQSVSTQESPSKKRKMLQELFMEIAKKLNDETSECMVVKVVPPEEEAADPGSQLLKKRNSAAGAASSNTFLRKKGLKSSCVLLMFT